MREPSILFVWTSPALSFAFLSECFRAMPNAHAPERAAWIGLVILTIVWSLNWTVMKVATHYSGPFTFSAQRYVIGTVVLFALLALRRNPLKPTPWLPTIAIGLTQTMAFQALAQWAL